MAITLANISTLVRYLINDNSTSGSDLFTYSTSTTFTLTEDNPIAVSEVEVNDSTSGVSYTANSTNTKITMDSSLTAGDSVAVAFTYYPNYSTSTIQNYVRAAIVHISANNYKDFVEKLSTIYPEPTEREKNLIASVAAILIEPDNKSYRLPDMSIISPKDIPTHEKIRKLIAIFKHDSHGTFFIT